MEKYKVWLVILVVIICTGLLILAKPTYSLQYIDRNGFIRTEEFKSKKEFNHRSKQLYNDSIRYWLNN